MSCTHDKVAVAWSGDCAKVVCLECGQIEHYHQEAEAPRPADLTALKVTALLATWFCAAFLWTQLLLDIASQS